MWRRVDAGQDRARALGTALEGPRRRDERPQQRCQPLEAMVQERDIVAPDSAR